MPAELTSTSILSPLLEQRIDDFVGLFQVADVGLQGADLAGRGLQLGQQRVGRLLVALEDEGDLRALGRQPHDAARPMPRLPPVTIAVLPSNRIMFIGRDSTVARMG